MKFTKISPWTCGILIGVFSLSGAFPAQAEEVKFLKVKFLKAQEELGGAILETALLRWHRERNQEHLGKLIQDRGTAGKIDQALLGKGIAEGALLTWREGAAQERLGSAILSATRVLSAERGIIGRIQEQLGKMILAIAQFERVDEKALEVAVRLRTGKAQEDLGRKIARKGRLFWAERELAMGVHAVLSSPRSDAIPGQNFAAALSVLRREFGYFHEEDLRLALTLIEKEAARPLKQILSAPVSVAASGSVGYMEAGWGGFWEFGFFALTGFVGGMLAYSWVLIGLDRNSYRGETEERIGEAIQRAA